MNVKQTMIEDLLNYNILIDIAGEMEIDSYLTLIECQPNLCRKRDMQMHMKPNDKPMIVRKKDNEQNIIECTMLGITFTFANPDYDDGEDYTDQYHLESISGGVIIVDYWSCTSPIIVGDTIVINCYGESTVSVMIQLSKEAREWFVRETGIAIAGRGGRKSRSYNVVSLINSNIE